MNERQSDFELLRSFLKVGDQPAFTHIVRRHLDLVYGTALRKVQDTEAAQEVAQNVFGALARKSWQFSPQDSLPAWLHRTTLLESANWLRSELRRRRREQTASELGTTMKTPDDQPALRALIPLLDEALLSLREKDRTALLLRFYENQALREVGKSLGVGEDAAQKRVTAALGKLTEFFRRRGFKTTTAAAAASVLQHTAASAPASVATTVLSAAAQASPPALLGLAALAAHVTGWTRAQTVAFCLTLAVVPIGWQWEQELHARARLLHLQTQLSSAQTELSSLQTGINRLQETSARLEASLAAETAFAGQREEAANKIAAWKNRLRALLTAKDYRWPEDSPFVRIPKPVVKRLESRQPITPPGVLKQSARELLGLTPQERERIETALQEHFRGVERVIDQQVYETNRPSHFSIPSTAVASHAWFIPMLGDEINVRRDRLQAVLGDTLGAERWALVSAQLSSSGTDTLRRVLNLDAGQEGQEVAVWVAEAGGKLTVGYGWAGRDSSFTSDGAALEQFKPGANLAPGMEPAEYLGSRALPTALTSRMLEWVRQQAVALPGKEITK